LDLVSDVVLEDDIMTVLKDIIDDHDAFIAVATLEFSQEDLARAISTSQATYDKVMALLNTKE
jgi:hypothetical protein